MSGLPFSLTKVELTAGEIEALTRGAFGAGARVTGVRAAEEGVYNAAYHLALSGPGAPDRVFLKVAPSPGLPVLAYEKDLLRTEIAVLEALGAAGVPAVPAVLATDVSHRIVQRDCLFMSSLAGESLSKVRRDIPPAECISLRRRIGEIASAANALSSPMFGYPGAPDLQAPTWRGAFALMVEALFADAARFGAALPAPAGQIAALFAAAAPLLDGVHEARLTHYDLWDGNVLVTRERDGWTVTGVIDWERTFWGDPLADVVSMTLFGAPEEKAALMDSWTAGIGAGFADDGGVQRRLALYRAYLWLIMIVEAPPRGHGGSILLPTSAAARRLMADLAIAAGG